MTNPTHKNPAAVALGKLARGIPKTLTPEQRERKREIMKQNRAKSPNNKNEGKEL